MSEVRERVSAEPLRRFSSPHQGAPRTHLLSNGSYCVMLTAAGSGYSRWREVAVTRWREDPTCDPWGSFVFLRDVRNRSVWSVGYQPVGREPDAYQVAFYEDRAEIIRTDGAITTATEFLVSAKHDVEVRHVSLTNSSSRVREIELTSYAEVALATPAADAGHPAFSKLFVQTEYLADGETLLAWRRHREGEAALYAFHRSSVEGEAIGALQYETDRARFIGRGHELRNASSIVDARPLSNSTGTVLDPVLAVRRRVRIAAGQTARVAFWTGVAPSRAEALAVADHYSAIAAFGRTKSSASNHARMRLRSIEVPFEEARQFQRIADRVLYSDRALRAPREILDRNVAGVGTLWSLGISGDLPILIARIGAAGELALAEALLRARDYWRHKGLTVDLVILNDGPVGAAGELEAALAGLIETAAARAGAVPAAAGGKVFCLKSAAMPSGALELLETAARAIFAGKSGSLGEQLDALHESPAPARAERKKGAPAARADAPQRTLPGLEFYNGVGGFAAAGREYATVLEDGQWTPAPWVNVIANPHFGCMVSADGAGCTWSLNARENQLTPWSNDPVSDAPGEVIYLRDEDGGEVWSATPLPIRDPAASYLIRHGFGYSRFEHGAHGVSLELLQFVPLEDPVKISRLKITNRGEQTRRFSISHYVEWVLGNQRSRTAPFIVTEIDPQSGALLARSPWNAGFERRVAFIDMLGRQQSCTGDRSEFLGRHGSLAEPAAILSGAPLSNRVGGGWDPCGALQTRLTLRPGEEAELVLLLGQEASREQAAALIARYRGLDLDASLKGVTDFWEQTLGILQVKTPDRSMDVMLNGWLLYQALGCRLFARAAFYQTSGAYGFRDQLQDVMSLCLAQPKLAREHILRAAARQFTAGDVQHWWLPSSGQGVRTRVADDRIWLPYVLAHYLEVTEDHALLDEPVGYLEEAPLAPGQQEIFSAPASGADPEPLYAHCVRALDSSLAIGAHGLPLFGTGDWNDGMNRVGAQGRGESVWLGWFLYATLMKFAPLAERRGDAQNAAAWRKHAFSLQQAIEREAWDGDWYRRGYYDDGAPLGSVSSDECRIDSIAQSWAVISGAGDPARAVRAMAAVNGQLVSRSDGLVQLFTPPFDRTAQDPGYIKAYPPGIRENGGQYTHASMWSTLAFALLGDGDRAAELFSLLNPINHASTRAAIHRYKVEPYVVCADVYSAPAHIGRGGWTWYTGSAGWMYRTAAEGILGIHLRGPVLRIDPCMPRAWPGFEVTFKYGSSRYHIAIDNPQGVSRGVLRATLDEREIRGSPCDIQLKDDGSYHFARITLGGTAV